MNEIEVVVPREGWKWKSLIGLFAKSRLERTARPEKNAGRLFLRSRPKIINPANLTVTGFITNLTNQF